MNGRVYDPSIARFLSPDVQVPFPEHTQSYNRYSYVQNNPLSRVDPSGYGDKECDKKCQEEKQKEKEKEKEKRGNIKKLKILLGKCAKGQQSGCGKKIVSAVLGVLGMELDEDGKIQRKEGTAGSKGSQDKNAKNKSDGTKDGIVLPRADYHTFNADVSILRFVDITFELNLDAYGELYFGIGLGLSDPLPASASITEGYITGYSKTPSAEVMKRVLTGTENQMLIGAGAVGGYSAAFRDITQFSEPPYSRSQPLHGLAIEAGIGTPQIGFSVNHSWRIGNIHSISNLID